MPKQVFDALKVILDEFGNCDLDPRLAYFAYEHDHDPEEGRELGRQLLRSFSLVRAWSEKPTMTPDDIRNSLEQSERHWGAWTRQEAA
jgi:hypothetical protein